MSDVNQQAEGYREMNDDPYEDVVDYIDWVTQPPGEILTAMNATLDANAGLDEEYD